MASVLGRNLELGPLAAVAGLSEDSAVAAMEEALTVRLVEETEVGAYRFVHALVRSALYEGLSTTRRARLHLRAADVFEQEDADAAARLAHHLVASAPLGRAPGPLPPAWPPVTAPLPPWRTPRRSGGTSRGCAVPPPTSALRTDLLTGVGEAQRRAGHPQLTRDAPRRVPPRRRARRRHSTRQGGTGQQPGVSPASSDTSTANGSRSSRRPSTSSAWPRAPTGPSSWPSTPPSSLHGRPSIGCCKPPTRPRPSRPASRTSPPEPASACVATWPATMPDRLADLVAKVPTSWPWPTPRATPSSACGPDGCGPLPWSRSVIFTRRKSDGGRHGPRRRQRPARTALASAFAHAAAIDALGEHQGRAPHPAGFDLVPGGRLPRRHRCGTAGPCWLAGRSKDRRRPPPWPPPRPSLHFPPWWPGRECGRSAWPSPDGTKNWPASSPTCPRSRWTFSGWRPNSCSRSPRASGSRTATPPQPATEPSFPTAPGTCRTASATGARSRCHSPSPPG